MARFLLICAGGAAGTGARYLLALWVTSKTGDGFPFGTLAVNVIGSFVMGFLFQLAIAHPMTDTTKLALTTGILGGFTTYSAFNQETLRFFQLGAWTTGLANLGVTVVSCLAAGVGGMLTAKLVA
jgi:CrcB protein